MPIHVCLTCSTSFNVPPSKALAGKGTYCSKACQQAAPSTQVPCICGVCGASFAATPFRIKTGRGKYCSKACLGKAQQRRMMKTCEKCGKTFETLRQYVARGQMRYCSRECAAPGRTRPEKERFWEKVDVRGPDECWPWVGAIQQQGYGIFTAFVDETCTKRQTIGAHVYAWKTINGPMPKGFQGNHTCDNPPCCNPSHVYAGTKKQNTADAMVRNHMKELLTPERTQGEKNAKAKLTEEQVREIRAISLQGTSYVALAKIYGVDRKTIKDIRWGLTWKHI